MLHFSKIGSELFGYCILSILVFTSLQIKGIELNPNTKLTSFNFDDSTKKKTEVKNDTINKTDQEPETGWPGPYNSDTVIYSISDNPPEFKGGNNALYEFMINNLIYPSAQQDSGITGLSHILFIVEQDGSVSNVRIEKSSGNAALDKEAIRVVKKLSGRFKPGKVKGKPVRTYCRLPVNFELDQ